MSGWFVSANDIRLWTQKSKRQAEDTLPLLVKKLILASCNPQEISFPSGDSVSVGGWDGKLIVEKGNEFVPDGISRWEFGTNNEVKGKADADYSKRTNDPGDSECKSVSFVFVTTRLWSKRDKWVNTKRDEHKWLDVRGLNAESLQDWLGQCPAVHRWFSQLIGKRCADTWDAEQGWSNFSNMTQVRLTTDFFLYKRDKEVERVKKSLNNSTEVLRIKSDSIKESLGFILSVIKSEQKYLSRCLIIKSQTAWDSMSSSNYGLILIPLNFEPMGLGAAVRNGNTILLPTDVLSNSAEVIVLDKISRLNRQLAFEKLGFSSEKSNEIYQETKGYLEPLLRNSSMQPIDYLKPDWITRYSPRLLFTIFFAEEWEEDNKNDRDIIEELSKKDQVFCCV